MDQLLSYIVQCLKPRDVTEFYQADDFNAKIFSQMKQDAIMITKTIPLATQAECELIKIGDYYLIKKISRDLAWLTPDGDMIWDLTGEPLYRRLLPPPEETVNQAFVIASVIQATNFDNKTYVEYGVRDGRTLEYVSSFVSKSHGVDMNEITGSDSVPSNCSFHKMLTNEFSQNILPQLVYQYAFIDADHKFESCLNDFDHIYQTIQPGGYIFLHDTYPCQSMLISQNMCHDCYKTPIAIKKRYPNIELVTLPLNPGLTIIRKTTDVVLQQKQSTIITSLYDVGNPTHMDQIDQWLKLTFPVIIWTDDTYYKRLRDLFQGKNNVMINKKNIDTYDIPHNSDSKMMYARPWMWLESIRSNPFKTNTFICMDFGLVHFTKNLSAVELWDIKDQVKMLMINPYLTTDPDPPTYFNVTRHNVAGGLVTGSGDNLIKLISLIDDELHDMKWYLTDETLMTCIVRKYPKLCDFYYGDYCSIICNYEKLSDMTNIVTIIQKYLDCYCHEQAQQVINHIDFHSSSLARQIYVEYSILTNYYVTGDILNPIARRILEDPEYQEEMNLIKQRQANNLKFYRGNPGSP